MTGLCRVANGRTRLLPAALVGIVFVLGAIIVPQPASATRLPEWGFCRPLAPNGEGHRYTDPGCLTVGSSKKLASYEWVPLAASRRLRLNAMTMSGSFELQTRSGKTILCTHLGGEGFARTDGPEGLATPLWEFEGCASEGRECRSGLTAFLGEINNTLAWLEEPIAPNGSPPGWDGRLGLIAKHTDPPVVGVLYSVRNKERLFAPISCGSSEPVLIGGDPKGQDAFISTIGPVDRMSEEFTETFGESAPGEQTPQGFEGHTARTIDAFVEGHWEPVALNATFHFRAEPAVGSVEIKASR